MPLDRRPKRGVGYRALTRENGCPLPLHSLLRTSYSRTLVLRTLSVPSYTHTIFPAGVGYAILRRCDIEVPLLNAAVRSRAIFNSHTPAHEGSAMGGVTAFNDLLIWQRSRAWSKAIFQHTLQSPFRGDRRLTVQINDSSASVMANIAEGFGRGTQGEFVLFLGYAIGSLDETQSHLAVAFDREYLSRDDYAALFGEGTQIRKMTTAFISSMVMPRSGARNARKIPDWSEQVWEVYERHTGRERPELFRKAAEAKRRRQETTTSRHRKKAR